MPRVIQPEIRVPGQRLGRHDDHDPRSLRYLVPATDKVQSRAWARLVPVFDQGDVRSCTGNACAGVLGTSPYFATLPAGFADNEAEAVRLYSGAETIDGDGPYPPQDHGSSGLSVAKAAKNAGLISGYQHITSIAAAHAAIQAGPFLTGTNWYDGMDTPDGEGIVQATGSVRGGHEYECYGYDADRDVWLFWNSWGSSWGLEGAFRYSTATFERLLGESGDATVLVPIDQPAPTPTPAPGGKVTATFTTDQAAWLHGWAAAKHVGTNRTAAAMVGQALA